MTVQPPPEFSGPVDPGSWPGAPRPARSGGQITDLIVSIILMIIGVVGFAFLGFLTLFLSMMSDGCYANQCNTGLMSVGWLIALAVPPAVFIGAIIWTIIRLARRKTAWWITLAGAFLAILVWAAGAGLMQAGLGR
ncbi:DUF6264 family protein [Arthrobacter sp. Y-9]|uniref:DUF6264 family protein n=1 Tax=Arthrobacter sp. Y-9 TaxID=3039385 RepID=UPI00241E9B87|nr:DUF6264 family protein [Arthrobacter sp. Y-9]WFR84513.1 DUF6264 family protein [Arthrobacter sp. Y-9]